MSSGAARFTLTWTPRPDLTIGRGILARELETSVIAGSCLSIVQHSQRAVRVGQPICPEYVLVGYLKHLCEEPGEFASDVGELEGGGLAGYKIGECDFNNRGAVRFVFVPRDQDPDADVVCRGKRSSLKILNPEYERHGAVVGRRTWCDWAE